MGLAVLVAVGGVVVYSVPGMSKPIKGLFTGGKDSTSSRPSVRKGAAADHGGRAREPGKLREQRRLLPGRGADDDHHDHARGDAGQEGGARLRARLGVAEGPAGQPEDHDQERRGQLRERQAHPRGGRDRRRSSTSRASTSRTSPRSRARSSWPSRTCRAPRTGSTGHVGCSRRATSRRRPRSRKS